MEYLMYLKMLVFAPQNAGPPYTIFRKKYLECAKMVLYACRGCNYVDCYLKRTTQWLTICS